MAAYANPAAIDIVSLPPSVPTIATDILKVDASHQKERGTLRITSDGMILWYRAERFNMPAVFYYMNQVVI